MKYNCAIVGCGRIAGLFEENKSRGYPSTHIGAYKYFLNTKVVAICDIDSKRLKEFKDRWDVPSTYTDYNEMLEKEDIDILSICTNVDTHKKIVCKAANSGVKAIFCEKPIAESLDDAKEMVSTCKKNNAKLSLNCIRRWFKFTQVVKDIIEEDALGDLISITGRCYPGLFYNGVHLIDNMMDICGDINRVTGYPTPNLEDNPHNNEPGVAGIIEFKNGVFGYVDLMSRENYVLYELELYFTMGKIIVNNLGGNIFVYELIDNKMKLIRVCRDKYPFRTCIINAVSELIGCIENDTESISNGRNAIKVMEVLFEFKNSRDYTSQK